MRPIESARNHVRKRGHTLAWRSGPRPWSPFVLYCSNCSARWRLLRGDMGVILIGDFPTPDALVAELNATPRELPTVWERIMDDVILGVE